MRRQVTGPAKEAHRNRKACAGTVSDMNTTQCPSTFRRLAGAAGALIAVTFVASAAPAEAGVMTGLRYANTAATAPAAVSPSALPASARADQGTLSYAYQDGRLSEI